MEYSLLADGKNICDLSFDDSGLGKCNLSNPEDVVMFCLYILSMLESLRNEHTHKTEPQGALHRLQKTHG